MGWSEWKKFGGLDKLYLYNKGDQCNDLTGGWGGFVNYGGGGSATFNDDYIELKSSASGSNNQYAISTFNKIDTSNYDSLLIVYDEVSNAKSTISTSINTTSRTGTNIVSSGTHYASHTKVNTSPRYNCALVLNTSNIEGYVLINIGTLGGIANIKEIYLANLCVE